jgi:hypothetical protein
MYNDDLCKYLIVYIGSTCDTLSKCMSNFNIKSKSRVNWTYDKFYMMIRQRYVCIYMRMYVRTCVCMYIHITF